VIILPVSQSSNYIEANFIGFTGNIDSAMTLLPRLKKQLLSLKLSGMPIMDTALSIISQCTNISRLELDHSKITDKGLSYLLSLEQLLSLNLVGTKITAAGIMPLKALKKLRSIYLYQTDIEKKDWPALAKAFPHVLLDSGGYAVPLFKTDTMIVKPPKIKH